MAGWNFVGFTDIAREYLSKIQAGKGSIKITKAKTGSSNSVSPNSLTDILSPKQEISVIKVSSVKEGLLIDLQLTNLNLNESYKMHQIGVYAEYTYGSETSEFLYVVAQCNVSEVDTIPAVTTSPLTMNYRICLDNSNSSVVQVLIDPAGLVTIEEFAKLCNYVGYNSYGVEVDFEKNTIERISMSESFTPGDFDDLKPWGGRKRCNLTDDGVVLSYYGDSAYTETGFLEVEVIKNDITYPVGTPVQVMVEQPKFWYKLVPIKTEALYSEDNPSEIIGYSVSKAQYLISTEPLKGFEVFPLFIKGVDKKEVDFVYLSAFSSSIQDWSTTESKFSQVLAISSENVYLDDEYIRTGSDEELKIYADGNYIDSLIFEAGSVFASIYNRIISEFSEGGSIYDKLFSEGYHIYNVVKSETEVYFSISGLKSGLKYGVEIVPSSVKSQFTITPEILTVGRGGGYAENNEYSPVYHKIQGLITDVPGEVFNKGSISDCPLSLSSVGGVSPAKGFSRHDYPVLAKRHNYNPDVPNSNVNGLLWQSIDYTALCCDMWLFLIEYASFSPAKIIGTKSKYEENSLYGCAYKTGLTKGNSSQAVLYAVDSEGQNQYCVSYRGEENVWGEDLYDILGVDFDIVMSPFSITCKIDPEADGNYSDILPYCPIPSKSGFPDRLAYLPDYTWAFLFNRNEGSSNGFFYTEDMFSEELFKTLSDAEGADSYYAMMFNSTEGFIGRFTYRLDSAESAFPKVFARTARIMYVPN